MAKVISWTGKYTGTYRIKCWGVQTASTQKAAAILCGRRGWLQWPWLTRVFIDMIITIIVIIT